MARSTKNMKKEIGEWDYYSSTPSELQEYIAFYDDGKPVLSSTAVMGEISISGALIKVDELANSLQIPRTAV